MWVFAFPVILCTIFLFMFSGLSTDGVPDPVPVAVVADSNWRGSSFSQVVDALSGRSTGEALLDVTETASAAEAQGMVEAGQAVGYLAVDAAGTPSLTLAQDAAGGLASGAFEADRSILDAVTSSYVRNEALVKAIAQKDPSVLSDPVALARALGLSSGIERVRLTHGTPDETVRYYYALLGMAALMAAPGRGHCRDAAAARRRRPRRQALRQRNRPHAHAPGGAAGQLGRLHAGPEPRRCLPSCAWWPA